MVTSNKQLPSIEELEQLSPQAIAVYAARAALRASVFLCAKHTLKDIWPKDTLRHSAALLGVWVFLRHVWSDAGAPNVKKNRDSLTARAAFASASARATARAAFAAASATATASASARAAFADDVRTRVGAAFAAADAALAFAFDARTYAAKADYVFLLENLGDEGAIWAQVPLWEGFERSEVAALQQGYLQELSDLGLDFLQDDARYAWGLTGSEAPSQEYLKRLGQRLHSFEQLWQLSETEHLDAATLNRILGDGTHAQGTGLTSLNAVRVVLVGPGGAGKTALNHLLQGPLRPQSSSASLEIDHNTIPDEQLKHLLSLAEEPTVNQLKLSTWDFAGQTLFYGLHQAFLHENCVYVLVVDNRHEQAPDAWLAQIDYVLRQQGTDHRSAPVLIVTNEYEGLTTKQNQNRLIREYPHLLSENSFFYFSCLESSGHYYLRFIKTLLSECLNSRHTIFAETQQAIEEIEKQFEEGKVELKSRDLHSILKTALAEKGQVANPIVELEKLKLTLENLGVIVPIGTQSVIDPNKVVSASYQLLCDNRLKQEMADRNGNISATWLQNLLSQDDAQSAYKAIELETLIGFLASRGLCFEKEGSYVFPDALTEQEHPDATAIYKKPDAEESLFQLRMHYDLDFLPFGLSGQLIQAAFKQCPKEWCKTEYLWRDGLMLQNGSAQAVLQLNKRKTRIDLTLRGEGNGNAFLEFKSLLKKIDTLVCTAIAKNQRVTPFVEIDDDQLMALSSQSLSLLLDSVDQLDNLVGKIKEATNMGTQIINNKFESVKNLQQNNGDHNQNTQTNITFTSGEEQNWRKVLEAFSKTELGKNLSTEQKEQLQHLKDIQQVPESKKSTVKGILEGITTTLGTAADVTAIAEFCAPHASSITPLILSMLGQN